ncbi:MAG: sigma-70 family RNA polymerase sigma factor [Lachnospiraceae bacterium]|nr:sigma-70 family RNA polymerase sigma factor [Lachnospiraceae bacterium]
MADYDHLYIASLVRRAQAGNSEAFSELYMLTYKQVYNYALRYLKDEHLAQDAVQDTYITAFKNLKGIKDPSLFVAWLNQINFHTCFDMCKKANSSYGFIDSEHLELTRDDNIEHNPEDMYEKQDEIAKLHEAIESLPFHEKQVIVMRYYNEMKLEEIAKALSISRSTVKRYLQNAKDKLSNL